GLPHQWMHDCFELFDSGGMVQDAAPKLVAVNLASGCRSREGRFDQRCCLGLIEPVHHRVGIMDRNTFFGEHFRRGGLPHAKRTRETQNKHQLAVDEFVLPQESKQWQKREPENGEEITFDPLKQMYTDPFELVAADTTGCGISCHIEIVIQETVRKI